MDASMPTAMAGLAIAAATAAATFVVRAVGGAQPRRPATGEPRANRRRT